MALNEEAIAERLADTVVKGAVAASSNKRVIAIVVAVLGVLAALYLVQRSRAQSAEAPIEEPDSVAA